MQVFASSAKVSFFDSVSFGSATVLNRKLNKRLFQARALQYEYFVTQISFHFLT
jgi:hypothetical protein